LRFSNGSDASTGPSSKGTVKAMIANLATSDLVLRKNVAYLQILPIHYSTRDLEEVASLEALEALDMPVQATPAAVGGIRARGESSDEEIVPLTSMFRTPFKRVRRDVPDFVPADVPIVAVVRLERDMEVEVVGGSSSQRPRTLRVEMTEDGGPRVVVLKPPPDPATTESETERAGDEHALRPEYRGSEERKKLYRPAGVSDDEDAEDALVNEVEESSQVMSD
jgi:hypothetical protein